MTSQNVGLAYRDLADKEIKVGHIVCYAALLSRCAVLRYGRVTALGTRHNGFSGANKPTLRVLGVREEAEGKWRGTKKNQTLTLAFFNRLLVVPDELVPEAALRLLRQTQLSDLDVTDG